METGIHNTSEIGRLRKVMLHRPGRELENLMPEYLERLLFDDIPYLQEAQREHDAFADCLRSAGVEVVYLTDLVVQSLTDETVRQELHARSSWTRRASRTPGPGRAAGGLSSPPCRTGRWWRP